jgi:hypothetical protein
MNILLGDFNAKLERKDIFKPKIWNEHLHEVSKNNRVGSVNFATSRNLIFKNTMFSHRSIRNITRTSPDRKTHNQIDHIFIDRRKHSSVLDVHAFGRADCDTDHYLVVPKFGERLEVRKWSTQELDTKRFTLKKLNKVEGKEQYQVKISKKSAALGNSDENADINRAEETVRENIKISAKGSLGYYYLKQYKQWLDKGCSKLSDQRNKARL